MQQVICAIAHRFAHIKTIECNKVVSSSTGFACSSWTSVKRYNLVALSNIHVCNKVVTMIRRIIGSGYNMHWTSLIGGIGWQKMYEILHSITLQLFTNRRNLKPQKKKKKNV